jgi:hypothetical protein
VAPDIFGMVENTALPSAKWFYCPANLMQIVRAVKKPTLAEQLGTLPHESPLLRKAARLQLATPESLESLSVARGCWHYRSPDLITAPEVSESDFSNAELAVALLSPSQPYSPHTIRLGAAMLGALGNDVARLAQLVLTEGCAAPVRYIANAALRFEPDTLFWQQLLDLLPETPPIKEGVMPHPSRFVSMTGMTRAGSHSVTIWIRPRPDLALSHG